ncbi:CPBP family intramembrane glutamic endopeptidase [Nonomuraea sp. NPDC002799]
MKITHPAWAVLITIAAMFAQVIVGVLPVMVLLDSGHPLYGPLGMIGTTLASLALVYAIRRLGRQPWRGVGLTRSWRAVPHLLLGALAGIIAIAGANALSVATGVAAGVPWEMLRPELPYLPLAIALALLGQAFPEELLWRGHLFDTLSSRGVSPRVVLIVVSVVFGALHIFSQSAADTVTERLLFLLPATALGFVCAVARARTGAVWMAVGVHTGFHMGNMVLPTRDLQFGTQLLIMTATLTVTGLLLLAWRRGPHAPARESQPGSDAPARAASDAPAQAGADAPARTGA